MSPSGDDSRISAVESRVATLEAQVAMLTTRGDRIESKVDLISDRLARAEERLAHLPSKETVVRIAIGTVATLTAVLVFADRIRALFGIVPP